MAVRRLASIVAGLALLTGLACTAEAVAAAHSGPPTTAQETADLAESCTLLKHGQYAELDRQMNAVQQAYEAGTSDDIHLMHVFRAFCEGNYYLDDAYQAWVKATPDSYAAHLARGVYLRDVAYNWRGSSYLRDVSPFQLEQMKAYSGQSVAELKASLALTTKPLLTYHAVIGLAAINGGYDAAKQALDAANRIDPKNFVVRYKYLAGVLPTRWGGSLEAMIAFRKEAEQAGLPIRQLDYFDDEIYQERYWLAHCQCRAGTQ